MFLVGLLAILFLATVNAAPLAFFTMLFLGNIGQHFSYLAVLPGAVAFKFAFQNILQAPVIPPTK